MGTKPVRIDNRKREKARRRRQTAAARAAVLAAALVLVAVLVVAGIIRHHKKTQTVQNDTSAQTVSQTENGTDTCAGSADISDRSSRRNTCRHTGTECDGKGLCHSGGRRCDVYRRRDDCQ